MLDRRPRAPSRTGSCSRPGQPRPRRRSAALLAERNAPVIRADPRALPDARGDPVRRRAGVRGRASQLTRSGTSGRPWSTDRPGRVVHVPARHRRRRTSLEPVTTPCGVPCRELPRCEAQPKVTTKVSSERVGPGTAITDTVSVEGLGERERDRPRRLLGPFPRPPGDRVRRAPLWSGNGRGERRRPVPHDRARHAGRPRATTRTARAIAAAEFVRATETACGKVVETRVVAAGPRSATQMSAQRTEPGAAITDRAVVTGLGVLRATVTAELQGPFATREAISCTGRLPGRDLHRQW